MEDVFDSASSIYLSQSTDAFPWGCRIKSQHCNRTIFLNGWVRVKTIKSDLESCSSRARNNNHGLNALKYNWINQGVAESSNEMEHVIVYSWNLVYANICHAKNGTRIPTRLLLFRIMICTMQNEWIRDTIVKKIGDTFGKTQVYGNIKDITIHRHYHGSNP